VQEHKTSDHAALCSCRQARSREALRAGQQWPELSTRLSTRPPLTVTAQSPHNTIALIAHPTSLMRPWQIYTRPSSQATGC
jgi:hypothetical protein